MKRKPISILQLAVITLAASTLCFIANVRAQDGNQRSDTSIADNPNLRRSRASSSSSSSGTISEKDKKFLVQAVSGSLQEVAEGKMAEKQGENAEVKKIGARMVADHTKAAKEAVELAKKKGIGIDTKSAVPRDMGKANFDSQYLYTMEKEHDKDIKAFEKEASSGDDADVKAWAARTLPTLKAHLAMVKDARKKVQ